MIAKIIFNKETSKVYCIDTEGTEYANFPVCFNYWSPHTPIENGTYEVSNENSDALGFGCDQGGYGAYGDFWMALDRVSGKGFHGWNINTNRSLTSGTYGCIRAENSIGCQICEAVNNALNSGVCVEAEVVGNVDESEFCVGYDGRQ